MDDLKKKLVQDDRYKNGIAAMLEQPQVMIALTNYCNFSCVYCSTSKIRNKPINMDFDLVKSLVDQASENGWRYTFGQTYEPFLHPEISSIIKYVAEKGGRYAGGTNGIAIKADAYGLPMNLIISYSATEEDYAYRASKMSYENYKNKLVEFYEHRIRHLVPGTISIQIADYDILENEIVYDKEIQDIDGIYSKAMDIATKLGVTPPDGKQEIKSKIAGRQAFDLFRDGETVISVQPTKIMPNSYDAFEDIPKQGEAKGYCDSCYVIMSIQADGKVAFCCCDPSAQAIAGTIDADTDLKGFWLGEEMNSIREHFGRFKPKHAFCTQCLANVSENAKPLLTVKNPTLVSEILQEHGVEKDLPWFQFPA